MSTEKDKVISNLKACIISCPGGVLAADLNKDYRSLVGEFIPFQRLGYPNLEEFLQFLPDFDVIKKAGQWYVQAKASGGSSHIAALVQGQKKTAKKPRRKAKFPSRFTRPPAQKYKTPSREIPHFMQQPSETRAIIAKPKAQYMPPLLRKAAPPSRSSSTRPAQPTVTYFPPTQPQPPSTKNASSRPPLLPTPSAAPARPPALPARAPAPQPAYSKAPQKSRSTIADRLIVQKKEANMSSISETPIINHNNGYPDVIPSKSAQFSNEVTIVDPVKSKKSSQARVDSPNKSSQSNPVDTQQFCYDKVSYLYKLNQYADNHNWPKPEFFALNRRVGNRKRPGTKYICRVCVYCTPIGSKPSGQTSVDCHEFSSYPDEFPDINQAMAYVAKKAYDSLLAKDTIKLPVTSDCDVILRRVSEMVQGKGQGVWMYQIEKMYKEKFNESLPPNLPAILDRSHTLELTKLAESYYIVRPKAHEESTKFFSPNYVSNLTVSKLTYPAEDNWDVFVSKVKSLNEIYIRIIGDQYSGIYETMSLEMDEHYMQNDAEFPVVIENGKYYALVTQDSSFRVLVTGCINNHYQVYLIDVGDVEFVEASSLRVLVPKFYQHPAQAIPCFLDGLADYDFALTNPDIQTAVFDLVLARSFASIISNREPIQLTLYDTENDEDINVNLQIKEKVDNSFCSPGLFEEGILKEIQVVTVDRNGQVFIQVPSWTLNCLNDKIALIGNGFFEVSHLQDLESVTRGKTYIWSNGPARVKVCDFDKNGDVYVEFIDTGGQKAVHFMELYEIEHLSEFLSKIPNQAVPVLLHDVNDGLLKPQQVQKFLDLVNSNSESPTIGKTIFPTDGVPVIEIFVRNESSNLLVSVNQNLSLDENISSRMSHVSFDTVSTYSTSTMSHADSIYQRGSLIPRVNEEMDIFVTGIASPHNFTVTPVTYLRDLNALAAEMLNFYNTAPKEPYKPSEGEYVAASIDGNWFRVKINKRMDNAFYSGSYLDHGHMDAFPVNDIRALPEKFKKIPCLSYRAQIHGIKPKNGDWNVEDCLRLREMIHNKKFISYIRAILFENEGKKLSLEIIDTSTMHDVYIAQQLIHEGRAIPCNTS